MYAYAQTNVQLLNQLLHESYPSEKIVVVAKAYKLAASLFPGHVQRSGRSEVAHGVGTASILCALRQPAELVAAGLIHNVYRAGDFGDGRRGRTGLSGSRRKFVKDTVGEEVEQYPYGFFCSQKKFRTVAAKFAACHNDLDVLSELDRAVVLLALAEQLDHHLDLARVYNQRDIERCRSYIKANGEVMIEIAGKLGFPALAAELARAFRETSSADIPQEILREAGFTRYAAIPPRSYRKSLWVALRRLFIR